MFWVRPQHAWYSTSDCFSDVLDGVLVLLEHLAQDAVEVGITWDLALDLVPRRIYESVKQSFDIFQVAHLLDSEEGKMIPLASSPFRMTLDPPQQVRCETYVVDALSTVQHVDARISPHDLANARFEHGTFQDPNGQTLRHPFDESSFPAGPLRCNPLSHGESTRTDILQIPEERG